MKKTTYLVSISIVTIVLVILGTIYHLGDIDIGWGLPWGADSKGKVISDTISLDDFDRVDMDISVMDVEMEEGAEASLYYECNKEKYVPQIEVKDGVLYVKQQKIKKIPSGNIKCKMKLVVQKSGHFKDFNINNNIGDVKIDSVACEKLKIDTDTGDVILSGCKSDTTDIDSDTGDIKLTDCKVGNCKIDNDTGDVRLTDCNFGAPYGDMYIDSDTGDVEVIGCPDLNLYETDFSTDIGDVIVNGKEESKHYTESAVLEDNLNDIHRFTIKNDIGDITVSQK